MALGPGVDSAPMRRNALGTCLMQKPRFINDESGLSSVGIQLIGLLQLPINNHLHARVRRRLQGGNGLIGLKRFNILGAIAKFI